MTESSIILRLTTLYSIDTAESVDEIMELVFYNYDAEFDSNASVYSVSSKSIDRIKSEHTGYTKRKPETKGAVIIEAPIPCPVPEDDGGPFLYRRKSHQEIHFNSEDEARLLAEQIFNNLSGSVIVTELEDINNYISSRIKLCDSEWFLACKESKRVKRWVADLCNITTTDLINLIVENE